MGLTSLTQSKSVKPVDFLIAGNFDQQSLYYRDRTWSQYLIYSRIYLLIGPFLGRTIRNSRITYTCMNIYICRAYTRSNFSVSKALHMISPPVLIFVHTCNIWMNILLCKSTCLISFHLLIHQPSYYLRSTFTFIWYSVTHTYWDYIFIASFV